MDDNLIRKILSEHHMGDKVDMVIQLVAHGTPVIDILHLLQHACNLGWQEGLEAAVEVANRNIGEIIDSKAGGRE
jgi:hypothetical protein